MLRTILPSRVLLCTAALALLVLSAGGSAQAEEPTPKSDKLVSGMSIVGNDEAPKSLVIVPWKSSQLGHSLDVSRGADGHLGPVDPEVFMRELAYYEIRTGSR